MANIPHAGSTLSLSTCVATTSRLSFSSGRNQMTRDSRLKKEDHYQKPSFEIPSDPKILDSRWSWVVCIGAFCIGVFLLGPLHAYGLILVAFIEDFHITTVEAAWVGSLAYGLVLLFGPLSSFIIDKYGHRISAVTGSVISALGFLLSSLVYNFNSLFGTFSFVIGVGICFAYTPSMCISALYFKKYIALASGLTASGSAIGTLVYTPLTQFLINKFSWRICLQIYSGIALVSAACGMVFRPVKVKRRDLLSKSSGPAKECIVILDLSLFKNLVFLGWSTIASLTIFGFYGPYVHMVKHAIDRGFSAELAPVLPMSYAAATATGRILGGRIADTSCVNHIYMFQAFTAIVSLCMLLLPFAQKFSELLAFLAVMGLADGIFATLLPVLTFDLLGAENAALAWGYLVGISSVFFVSGPVFTAAVRDWTGKYDTGFRLAGACVFFGSSLTLILPLLIKIQKRRDESKREKEESESADISDIQYSGNGSEYVISPAPTACPIPLPRIARSVSASLGRPQDSLLQEIHLRQNTLPTIPVFVWPEFHKSASGSLFLNTLTNPKGSFQKPKIAETCLKNPKDFRPQSLPTFIATGHSPESTRGDIGSLLQQEEHWQVNDKESNYSPSNSTTDKLLQMEPAVYYLVTSIEQPLVCTVTQSSTGFDGVSSDENKLHTPVETQVCLPLLLVSSSNSQINATTEDNTLVSNNHKTLGIPNSVQPSTSVEEKHIYKKHILQHVDTLSTKELESFVPILLDSSPSSSKGSPSVKDDLDKNDQESCTKQLQVIGILVAKPTEYLNQFCNQSDDVSTDVTQNETSTDDDQMAITSRIIEETDQDQFRTSAGVNWLPPIMEESLCDVDEMKTEDNSSTSPAPTRNTKL